MREIIRIKQAFIYFQENKSWIIGILYICSIVKEVIWFSLFGINILTFISIQDTFISFFNHTIIFIILYLNYLFFTIVFLKLKEKFLSMIVYVLFLVLSFVYFQLLKKPVSLIFIVIIFGIITMSLKKKEYKNIFIHSLVFLIAFSTIEPLIQAIRMKTTLNYKKKDIQFEWNETNLDFYSFTYEKEKIDTRLQKYFLIGNNKEYFFIFDESKNRSLIIPKRECKQITAEFKFP
jgi:hypothetical protein